MYSITLHPSAEDDGWERTLRPTAGRPSCNGRRPSNAGYTLILADMERQGADFVGINEPARSKTQVAQLNSRRPCDRRTRDQSVLTQTTGEILSRSPACRRWKKTAGPSTAEEVLGLLAETRATALLLSDRTLAVFFEVDLQLSSR